MRGGVAGFDEEDVVAAERDDVPGVLVLGVLVLGVHGVGGDGLAGQVEVVQLWGEGAYLVAFGVDLLLGEDDLGVVPGGGEQVEGACAGTAAAQVLRRWRCRPGGAGSQSGRQGPGRCRCRRRGVGQVGEVAVDGLVEGVAVQSRQQAADGADRESPVAAGGDPDPVQQVGGGSGGVSADVGR